MGWNLFSVIEKIEQFVRIDRLSNTSDAMRARSILMVAFTFIASQILNLSLMTYTYGRWTIDHSIAIALCFCMAGVIFTLRYTKKFVWFAGFFAVMLFAGVGMSASYGFTGINSALLPFIVGGSIIAGFVSGWRTVLVYWAASLLFIAYLYNISTTAPAGALFDPAFFHARNFQRMTQMVIVFSLVSLIVSYASYRMHSAFFLLEEKIALIEQAQQEKSMFFANMSHELRTPLNGIMGFCALLEGTNLNMRQASYAGIVTKSSKALLSIVNDALDISKIDAGKVVLKAEPFNLQGLIGSVMDLYDPVAVNKGLTLNVNIPPNAMKVYKGDEGKLRQVLNNLVSNAIKFTETGQVSIMLEPKSAESPDNIVIHVRDSGIGIPKNGFSKVFDRFAQIDNSLSRDTEGTGLGLAICREIVEQMGGSITLDSELGCGSVFTIRLDLPTIDIDRFTEEAA